MVNSNFNLSERISRMQSNRPPIGPTTMLSIYHMYTCLLRRSMAKIAPFIKTYKHWNFQWNAISITKLHSFGSNNTFRNEIYLQPTNQIADAETVDIALWKLYLSCFS